MDEYLVTKRSTYENIGNSIRRKTGKTELIDPEDMPAEIDGITASDLEITDGYYMFYGGARTDSLDALLPACKTMTRIERMFDGCSEVTALDLNHLDVSQVDVMTHAFCNCQKLETLNIDQWDTSNVTTLYNTFLNCYALNELNISDWDVGAIESLQATFGGCKSLKKIDLSGWNTAKLKTFIETFSTCEALEEILWGENWSTSNVTAMSKTFYGCKSLSHIDLSGFDTGLVKSMEGLFYNCSSLLSVNFGDFSTGAVTTMKEMFRGCKVLQRVDMGKWDTSKVTAMNSMFYDCKATEEIIGFSATNKAGIYIGFPTGTTSTNCALNRLTFRTDLEDGVYAIRSAINIFYCNFGRDGMVEMFNTLSDVSGLGLAAANTKITITGNPCITGTAADGSACDVLTDEDRAIATNKGWTLVE